jgi:hypothetical protein
MTASTRSADLAAAQSTADAIHEQIQALYAGSPLQAGVGSVEWMAQRRELARQYVAAMERVRELMR